MKPSYLLLAALTMTLSGSLVACSGADAQEEADSTDEELRRGTTKTIGEAEEGKTVSIHQGDTLVVKLPANATTGYAWRVKSVDRTLGYPKITYKASSSGAVGSGGTASLTWKTTGPLDMTGSHKVALEYQRPWAETAPPADTYTFTLKIVKAGVPFFGGEGQMCGGFAGLPCDTGLKCIFGHPPSGAAADMSGICRAPKSCVVSGCSGQVCDETSRFTTCIYRPEFACYHKPGVKCEQQPSGQCEWTLTAAAKTCLGE